MQILLYDKNGKRVQYMRIADFAVLAKCSKATVYIWIAQGLPKLKLGPAVTLIPVQAARDWIIARFYTHKGFKHRLQRAKG